VNNHTYIALYKIANTPWGIDPVTGTQIENSGGFRRKENADLTPHKQDHELDRMRSSIKQSGLPLTVDRPRGYEGMPMFTLNEDRKYTLKDDRGEPFDITIPKGFMFDGVSGDGFIVKKDNPKILEAALVHDYLHRRGSNAHPRVSKNVADDAFYNIAKKNGAPAPWALKLAVVVGGTNMWNRHARNYNRPNDVINYNLASAMRGFRSAFNTNYR
jgi:hypothetical protein